MVLFGQALRDHPSLKYLDISSSDYTSAYELRHLLWSTFKLERFLLGGVVGDTTQDLVTMQEQKTILEYTGQQDPVSAIKRVSLPVAFIVRNCGMLYEIVS